MTSQGVVRRSVKRELRQVVAYVLVQKIAQDLATFCESSSEVGRPTYPRTGTPLVIAR